MRNSLFTLLCALPLVASAQISRVNPVPQNVERPQEGRVTCIPMPKGWQIVSDQSRTNSLAAQCLNQVLHGGSGKDFPVRLGIKGDKTVKTVQKLIPQHPEGYYLKITPKEVVIAASDEQGLFYGVQTFLQSMERDTLEACTVTDFPDVPFRGVVEGFYGTPWSHEARLSQLEFYGRHKMNVYIYGPKDDPWHRDHWRVPYPEKEGAQIAELAEKAKACGVKFTWAIHPGVDIKWTDADRDALIAKFEKMYELGVRSFAVFFDDITGEGTRADKQAWLLNYVDDHFIKLHTDVAPLVMCPTEYNRSWVNEKRGYLRTLGKELHPSIQIMWTGNTVVHCIDRESMEWVNARIQRKAYIWWNYPVSDYVRDHLLLGPTYGNDLDINSLYAGFVSNPMEHAEASKISLYSVADYTWHGATYDAYASWEAAIEELLPSHADALRIFAMHNEDPGPNGHGFKRDEWREGERLCKTALTGHPVAVIQLLAQAEALGKACNELLQSTENPRLIKELRPWLLQGKQVAEYGVKACTTFLQSNSEKDFLPAYERVVALQKSMYELENDKTLLHAHQTGIKVAAGRMLPTLTRVFQMGVAEYNKKNGAQLEAPAAYSPYYIESSVPQLAALHTSVNGAEVRVSDLLEVLEWPAEGSFTLTADRVFGLAGLDFNFGVPDMAQHFKLEVLNPQGEWMPISLCYYSEGETTVHTGNEINGMRGTALRLTNVSGAPQSVYFKKFRFVKR